MATATTIEETSQRFFRKRVELNLEDKDGEQVLKTDRRRYRIQKQRAADILRLANHLAEFESQFDFLMTILVEWSSRQNIEYGIVTFHDDGLAFVVVQSFAEYDEDLTDTLADLEFGLANDSDLSMIKLNTIVLPAVSSQSLQSFLDERLCLVCRGQGS